MTTAPQPATEREQLIAALEKSRDSYLRMLSSIAENAAGAKLDDSSWSILQIAEHVAAAEHGMSRMLERAEAKTSPVNRDLDARLIAAGTNRQRKVSAPETSRPKGRWSSIAECAKAFELSRARTLDLVRAVDDLRGKVVQHPVAGEIDGHQLVLIMAGHPERHALQIEEIKASAAYQAAERG